MQAAGQVQRGFGEGSEGSGEGLGGFGAEPGHVQQGSGEGEKVWALVQSQVRFNRILEEVWCRARWDSTGFQKRFLWRSGRLWCRAKSGSTGFLTHGNPAEVFPALGFAARFRKICKHKSLRLLGIRPKLIYFHRNTPQVLLYQYVPEWN